jgi:hypothetical protein
MARISQAPAMIPDTQAMIVSGTNGPQLRISEVVFPYPLAAFLGSAKLVAGSGKRLSGGHENRRSAAIFVNPFEVNTDAGFRFRERDVFRL